MLRPSCSAADGNDGVGDGMQAGCTCHAAQQKTRPAWPPSRQAILEEQTVCRFPGRCSVVCGKNLRCKIYAYIYTYIYIYIYLKSMHVDGSRVCLWIRVPLDTLQPRGQASSLMHGFPDSLAQIPSRGTTTRPSQQRGASNGKHHINASLNTHR